MKLTNEFQSIRDWAKLRGIYEKGDLKTQFIKLSEEVGELGKAILNSNEVEIIDAIGDIVVVLTNLTELAKIDNNKIEDCVNSAFNVIANRQGKMENGTFIKNK
jgi:NTP pyrophosphatase (non-canonical NTP hydrolase)